MFFLVKTTFAYLTICATTTIFVCSCVLPIPLRVSRGTFFVLTDGNNRPSKNRVLDDIDAFARQDGYMPYFPESWQEINRKSGKPYPLRPEKYELIVSQTMNISVTLRVDESSELHRITLNFLGGGDSTSQSTITKFYTRYQQKFSPVYGSCNISSLRNR